MQVLDRMQPTSVRVAKNTEERKRDVARLPTKLSTERERMQTNWEKHADGSDQRSRHSGDRKDNGLGISVKGKTEKEDA